MSYIKYVIFCIYCTMVQMSVNRQGNMLLSTWVQSVNISMSWPSFLTFPVCPDIN